MMEDRAGSETVNTRTSWSSVERCAISVEDSWQLLQDCIEDEDPVEALLQLDRTLLLLERLCVEIRGVTPVYLSTIYLPTTIVM